MNTLLHEYLVAHPPLIEVKPIRLPGYEQRPASDAIRLLVAEDNYTRLHVFKTSQPLLVSQTLKLFADQLPEFVRANKGTLVNPTIISKAIVYNSKQMALELATGELIGVSRRRMETVLAQLSLPPLTTRRRP